MDNHAASSSRPSTVYGPVNSWRFGRSLGIDPILHHSTCSFNCIYCQLGAIQQVTLQQKVYVPTDCVRQDLARVDWPGVDVVTISGSGEPTLATNLGEIVAVIKDLAASPKPVHLLTNSTLLHHPAVRGRLMALDEIACKLDAADDEGLRLVNRPAEGVTWEQIFSGICALRREFQGRLTLQVMCMPLNLAQVKRLAEPIRAIAPDEVQLNTPKRPYPLEWYQESRGDHEAKEQNIARRTLKVITPEEAAQLEIWLKETTGVPLVSVYRS